MFDPRSGGRRSIRLPTHDYAGGGEYFITLCAARRARLFGDIVNGTVHLTAVGQIIRDLWTSTPNVRPGVVLDEFVVMPDHLHAIVALPCTSNYMVAQEGLARTPRSLGALIAGYKAQCTSRVTASLGQDSIKLWQRNYHERVIRPHTKWIARRYITANPGRWRESRHGNVLREGRTLCAPAAPLPRSPPTPLRRHRRGASVIPRGTTLPPAGTVPPLALAAAGSPDAATPGPHR